MINIKLITNIFKILCLIGLIILVMNSCQDSTLPNEPELRLLSQEQATINPGELPEPMIVGGYPVDPACPNCKYDCY